MNNNYSKLTEFCKNFTGKFEFEEETELINEMFGDIVATIELYNRIIQLYTIGKFSLKKYSVSRQKIINVDRRIDQKLLEFKSFLTMIKNERNDEQRLYFCNIIKNLLKILFENDSSYDVSLKLVMIESNSRFNNNSNISRD